VKKQLIDWFLNNNVSTPTVQASDIVFSSVTSSGFTVSWTAGSYTDSLVVMHESASVDDTPINGIVYTANAAFGTGDQVGIDNYVVYRGSGTSVAVTGLTSNRKYYVQVFSVQNSGVEGSSLFVTGTATDNPLDQNTSTVSELSVTLRSTSLQSFNSPNSERIFTNGSTGHTQDIDASIYDEVKIAINVTGSSASANTPRGYPGYSFTPSAPYTYTAVGSTTGTQTVSFTGTGAKVTDWLTLPEIAKATSRWGLLENGGDGVADPTLNSIVITFRQVAIP